MSKHTIIFLHGGPGFKEYLKPYFNEPSYERDINTSKGNKRSLEYNMNIRYYNMKHLIYNTFINCEKYSFKDVIKKHFLMKKEYILEICKKWVDEAEDYFTNTNKNYRALKNYKEIYNKILEMYIEEMKKKN